MSYRELCGKILNNAKVLHNYCCILTTFVPELSKIYVCKINGS